MVDEELHRAFARITELERMRDLAAEEMRGATSDFRCCLKEAELMLSLLEAALPEIRGVVGCKELEVEALLRRYGRLS